jgi:hypothetical protein
VSNKRKPGPKLKKGPKSKVKPLDKRSKAYKRGRVMATDPRVGFNLLDNREFLLFLEQFGYNMSWATDACGLAHGSMLQRAKRQGCQAEIRRLRADWEEKNGSVEQAFKMQDARIAAKLVVTEIEERRKIDAEELKINKAKIGQEEVYRAICNAGGILGDAATFLRAAGHELTKSALVRMVANDEYLQEACELGEKELHLYIRDDILSASRGQMTPKKEQSKWMLQMSKARMGWTEKTKVEHSGSVGYDTKALPTDLKEPDLPPLSVVNGGLKKEED